MIRCAWGLVLATVLAAAPAVWAEERSALEMYKHNFTAADTDRDGSLSRDEFKVFIDACAEDDLGRTAMVRRLGFYQKAFAKMDVDGSGLILMEELSKGGG